MADWTNDLDNTKVELTNKINAGDTMSVATALQAVQENIALAKSELKAHAIAQDTGILTEAKAYAAAQANAARQGAVDDTATNINASVEAAKADCKAYTDAKLVGGGGGGGTVDLTNYYTKTVADTTFAAKTHTHTIANVTGLQTALDAKFTTPATLTEGKILGVSGGALTLIDAPAGGGAADLTWVGNSGDTYKCATAAFTAVAGNAYLVRALSSSYAITLPAMTAGADIGKKIRFRHLAVPSNGAASLVELNILTSASAQLHRLLYGTDKTFIWDGAVWQIQDNGADLAQVADPITLWDWRKHTRTEIGRSIEVVVNDKIIKTMRATSDFTMRSSSSGGGNGPTITQVTDSIHGAYGTVNFNYVTNGSTTRGYTVSLGQTIDLTNKNLRCYVKINCSDASKMKNSGFEIRVYSNNAQNVDYSKLTVSLEKVAANSWMFVGGGNYVSVGAGANLAAITHVEFLMNMWDAGLTWDWSISDIRTYDKPVKPKLVLTLDGSYSSHVAATGGAMIDRGLKGTIYGAYANQGMMTPDQHEYLRNCGFQLATHIFTSNASSSVKSGEELYREFTLTKRFAHLQGYGIPQHNAFYNTMTANDENRRFFKSLFATSRMTMVGSASVIPEPETCPPRDPWALQCYMFSTADQTEANATYLKAYLDKVIAAKGMAMYLFHEFKDPGATTESAKNPSQLPSAVTTFLDYCKTKVDAGEIECCTLAEALAPYTRST